MSETYLQFGCGLCAPITWRNFDASPTLRLQKIPIIKRFFINSRYPVFPSNVEYGDVVRGLPVEKESCRAIYCSHVLEHLALDDLRVALKHIYLLLEKDGIFRFVIPDLEYIANRYVQSEDPQASYVFMEQSHLGMKARPRSIMDFLRSWFGNSQHLWMWDYKSIRLELEKVGFKDIRRVKFNDNSDPKFYEVEDEDRWKLSLGVECYK